MLTSALLAGDEVDETTKLRKENKKLKKYIDKFKEELKGLDHVGFFLFFFFITVKVLKFGTLYSLLLLHRFCFLLAHLSSAEDELL